jgi:hypothetical protein
MQSKRFWARGNISMILDQTTWSVAFVGRREGLYVWDYVVRTFQLVIGSTPTPAYMHPPTPGGRLPLAFSLDGDKDFFLSDHPRTIVRQRRGTDTPPHI